MKAGFLISGPEDHGLHRYASMICNAARRAGFTTTTAFAAESGQLSADSIRSAAGQFDDSDACFIQFNCDVWGGVEHAAGNLKIFFDSVRCPVITTIHDLQYIPGFPTKTAGLEKVKTRIRKFVRNFRRPGEPGRVRAAFDEITTRSAAVIGFNQRETEFLESSAPGLKVECIPHFVENMQESLPSVARARERLGIPDDCDLITMLGFIHPRKSHHVLLQAAPRLKSGNFRIVFAGKCKQEKYLNRLHRLAEKNRLADRLTITGFLPQDELNLYLRATDVAVCPFKDMAASGSISTWIAADVPVVASRIPGILDYNRISPDAIHLTGCSPNSLANAIDTVLKTDRESFSNRLETLRNRLDLTEIAASHIHLAGALLP